MYSKFPNTYTKFTHLDTTFINKFTQLDIKFTDLDKEFYYLKVLTTGIHISTPCEPEKPAYFIKNRYQLTKNFPHQTKTSDTSTANPPHGINSQNIENMWTLKHEIISPKFYEIIIKNGLNGGMDLDVNNFYNRIKMSLH